MIVKCTSSGQAFTLSTITLVQDTLPRPKCDMLAPVPPPRRREASLETPRSRIGGNNVPYPLRYEWRARLHKESRDGISIEVTVEWAHECNISKRWTTARSCPQQLLAKPSATSPSLGQRKCAVLDSIKVDTLKCLAFTCTPHMFITI